MPDIVLRRRFTHSHAKPGRSRSAMIGLPTTAVDRISGRQRIQRTHMTSPLPVITIGVVAYNEERSIPKAIRSLQAASQYLCGGVEFIVLASGCTDRTVEVAIEAFDGDHRALVI